MGENRVWGPHSQTCTECYLGHSSLAWGQRLLCAGGWPEVGPRRERRTRAGREEEAIQGLGPEVLS